MWKRHQFAKARMRTPRVGCSGVEPPPRRHWRGGFACAAFASFLWATAIGAPYAPSSDAVIVERLPASAATRELAPLRRRVGEHPNDTASALQLAKKYIEIGRVTSDPRFVSYAQAVLAPWMQRPNPSASVLVMQATALQNLHRFDAALALLEQALKLEPNNSQAWLTRATLLQVKGRFSEARRACQHLLRADQLLALTCIATVDSLSGQLAHSYETLDRLAATDPRGQRDAWIQGQLAEMAVRMGESSAAERHFKAALRVAPDDVYVRAAYADLLLLQRKDTEIVAMLRDATAHDVLLLRLAIAARRLTSADADRWSALFDARRRAARPDDNPHLREHARYFLEVVGKPQQALAIARKNWDVQREPADVEIYLRAARAAGSVRDERVVQKWIADTGFEDAMLAMGGPRTQM